MFGMLFFLSGMSARGQVSAVFSASPTMGCGPLSVTFNSTASTGPLTGYQWDFGDGNSSVLQNPSHTYNSPGQYTVTLIVDDGVNYDTLVQTNYITVYADPTPGFTASQQTGCFPLPVQFTDTSLAGSGTISSWLWDFGDGTVDSIQHPTHTYASAGSFTVSLTVTNSFGCTETGAFPGFIHTSTQPTVSFGANPDNGCTAPLTVNFSNASFGTGVLSWFWDFGDGNTSTQFAPSHTYSSTGTYDVKLVVTDQNGCSDSLIQPQLVNIGVLNADYSAVFPICDGNPMQFTDLSTGGAVSWLWDFGDGTTSTQQNPAHVYPGPGNYTVKLVATSSAGCQDSITRMNYVTVYPGPVVNFTADTTNGCGLPFTVDFSNSSTGGTYFWDFGDGGTSTLFNPPPYNYTIPGVYTVKLIVTRPNGCSDSLVRPAYIVIDPPQADFTSSTPTGCPGHIVNFSDQSTTVDSLVSWSWDFGDGNTSTQQNPSHAYAAPGSYNVTLTVTDSRGCTRTIMQNGYVVIGFAPTAGFIALQDTQCYEDSTYFVDNSTNANAWFWDFGDGDTSNLQSPVHLYPDTGVYTVTQTVYNNGCPDQLQRINYIVIRSPVNNFSFSPPIGCSVPHTVTFSDSSYGGIVYEWSFGDGGKDSIPSPTHTYTSFGTYTVYSLVSDTTTGCTDVDTAVISIASPNSGFTAFPRVGCAPLTVNFSDTSSANVPITGWEWDFGDGATDTVQNPVHIYTTPGKYDVSLIIFTGNGCSDTIVTAAYITVNGPEAGFSSSLNASCPGTNVFFADTSSSNSSITGWSWNFGDGNFSTLQNPTHAYANPGTYTVSLSVTDSFGCSATATYPGYIVITQPVAGFAAADTFVCPGNPVVFANTSTGTGLSYNWNFGDGNSSTQTNPTHSYSTADTFAVVLNVTDTNGCTSTDFQLMIAAYPVADFAADTTLGGCPPFLVNFSDSSSADIVAWEWDFGDSTSSNLPNPSKVYTQSGSFTVTLIVTSSTGCRDTLVRPAYITLAGPAGAFTFSPDTACAPALVNFVGTASAPVSYQWDFGDGTVITGGDSIFHTYTQTGIFHPLLIITDSMGCSEVILTPDSILIDSFPVVDFMTPDTFSCGPDSVRFFNLTSSSRPITSWSWDFGDGGTDTISNPVHYYGAPGIYSVTLQATHELGCSASQVRTTYIQIAEPPLAAMGLSDTIICVGDPITFSDNSVYLNGPGTVFWDFGNGATDSVAPATYVYPAAGTYAVQLNVTDSLGCPGADSAQVDILPGPVANFISADTHSCLNYIVAFQDQSTGAVNWQWDFGDGATGTGANPTHIYTTAGLFTVSLVVTDAAGCTDTLIRPDYVQIFDLQADFVIDSTAGCFPLTIYFRDSSLSDTTILNWQWNFGNGNLGNGSAPNTTYNTYGAFTVTLSVTDAVGCRDSTIFPNFFNFLPPDQPQIHAVTVLSDNSDSLTFTAWNGADFGAYRILREDPVGSGAFVVIDSILVQGDTFYVDANGVNPNQNSHCYRLQAVNTCGDTTPVDSSRVHCTMNLTALPAVDMVMLSWTPYVGWDQIARYEVYRVTDYADPGQLIATTDSATLAFVDTNTTCRNTLCYRIRAVESTTGQISWSDTACATPIHYAPAAAPEVVTVTVPDNQNIRVDWNTAAIPAAMNVELERSLDGITWNAYATQSAANNSYTDANVNVQTQPYYYRIWATDSCGDSTLMSNYGRSIVLNLTEGTGVVNLDWNSYEVWQNNVQEYLVEGRANGATAWTVRGTVPGTASASHTFQDVLSNLESGGLCYRIRAIENGGNGAESISNEVCVSPEIWVPNTITPNGDGANDNLEISALQFYSDNEITIYNRWGNLVFEASGYQNNWNGTEMKSGRPLPDGTYYYVLKIASTDQTLKGYIQLLR